MSLSAGADVREELDDEGKVHRMQLFADLYDGIVGFPKPTIAVCHGDVVGGGAEIAVEVVAVPGPVDDGGASGMVVSDSPRRFTMAKAISLTSSSYFFESRSPRQ
jgi:hypothetical protein